MTNNRIQKYIICVLGLVLIISSISVISAVSWASKKDITDNGTITYAFNLVGNQSFSSSKQEAVAKERIKHLLFDSKYAVNTTKKNRFPYPNNHSYFYNISDGTYTINFGGGCGCFAYAAFAQGLIYNKANRSNQTTIKAKGMTVTPEEVEKFIKYEAQVGEHIRTDGDSPHSLSFVSCDDEGFFFLNYGNDKNPYIYLDYTTWENFAKKCNSLKAQIVLLMNVNKYINELYVKHDVGNYDLSLQTVKTPVTARLIPISIGSETRKIEQRGTVVRIKDFYVNMFGNTWFKTDKGDWIYSGNLGQIGTYYIEYDANGGEKAPSTQSKKQGESINLSQTIPIRKNYKFLGWSTDKKAKTANYKTGETYSEDKSIYLYAVWESNKTKIELSKYDATLCINDKNTTTVDVKISRFLPLGLKVQAVGGAHVSAKVGTINDGVFSDKTTVTLTGLSPGNNTVVIKVLDSKSKLLTSASVYVTVTKKYSLTYNTNGGDGVPAKQTKMHGKSLILTETMPTKTNHTFMGWAEDSKATVPMYGPGDLYTNDSDKILYAVWKEKYNIAHSYDEKTRTLTINGKGDMANYSTKNPAPWQIYSLTAQKVVVNPGVTSIGTYAFNNFLSLQAVSLPLSVSHVQGYAFASCKSLKTVTAAKYTSIGNRAFANCSKLEKFSDLNTKSLARSAADTESETVTTIGAYAFENCVNLETFEISDNTTAIGASAFSGCESLDNIVIPESVTKLEDTVFFDCASLETIAIPESIININDGVFAGCSSLSEIEIPETVSVVGDQVFSGCASLESVEIPEGIKYIGDSVFSNCTALTSVDLPDSIEYLGDAMFAGCSSLTSIEIPENVCSIGDGTFSNCTSLSEIMLPEQVCVVGAMAFSGCSSLNSFDAFDEVTNIEDYAFYGCTGLQNVRLSDNVTEIGVCAFMNCTSLESLYIPESIETVEMGAFMNCTALNTVEIGEAPLSIEDEAFAGCTSLANITLPESTISVSSSAFSDCSKSFSLTCYSTSANYEEIVDSNINYITIYPVEGIELAAEKTSLNSNETVKLEPIFTPVNSTNKIITWVSENEDIAKVDENGVVTAIGSGIAKINATTQDGKFVASIFIECIIPLDRIEIINAPSEMIVDTIDNLNYTFYPYYPEGNSEVIWSSSKPEIISIDDDGIITAKNEGEATLTVSTTDGALVDSIRIKSRNLIPIEEVVLEKTILNMNIGESYELNFNVVPANADILYYEYYSDNEDVVSVDEYGIITACGVGSAEVELIVGSYTCICKVNVTTKLSCGDGNHTYGVGIIAKEPTCAELGVKIYICTSCSADTIGHTKNENIAPLGHTEPDKHGNCVRCSKHLVDVCKWCGGQHNGFFKKIIGFFHNILASILGAKF